MHVRRSVLITWSLAAALAGAAVVGVRPVAAQESKPTLGYRNLLTIDPLGIPFEYFSVEYERMMTGLVSVGLIGSYLGWGDGSFTTLESKLRFYLNEEAPDGFAVGLAGGITRVQEDEPNRPDQAETRPTIGVIVDYSWILGKAQRFVVSTGVGAKRVLGVKAEYNDIPTAYPTARFQVGIRY
ncbi:MAG: hypothetical protein IT361_09350 [Gemmatimonadaceae bacterium]|nr:hypothetical protein [Gemmatimonadaceae bacterium]